MRDLIWISILYLRQVCCCPNPKTSCLIKLSFMFILSHLGYKIRSSVKKSSAIAKIDPCIFTIAVARYCFLILRVITWNVEMFLSLCTAFKVRILQKILRDKEAYCASLCIDNNVSLKIRVLMSSLFPTIKTKLTFLNFAYFLIYRKF